MTTKNFSSWTNQNSCPQWVIEKKLGHLVKVMIHQHNQPYHKIVANCAIIGLELHIYIYIYISNIMNTQNLTT